MLLLILMCALLLHCDEGFGIASNSRPELLGRALNIQPARWRRVPVTEDDTSNLFCVSLDSFESTNAAGGKTLQAIYMSRSTDAACFLLYGPMSHAIEAAVRWSAGGHYFGPMPPEAKLSASLFDPKGGLSRFDPVTGLKSAEVARVDGLVVTLAHGASDPGDILCTLAYTTPQV